MRVGIVFCLVAWPVGAWTTLHAHRLGWRTSSLTLHVNSENCPLPKKKLNCAIDLALTAWNEIPGSRLRVVRDPTETKSTVADFLAGRAEAPVILCDANFKKNARANPQRIPAATVPGASDPYTYGGILLNAVEGAEASIGQTDLPSLSVILAHELGHLLGLGHSLDPKSLMYFNAGGKREALTSADDREAITRLYPMPSLPTPLKLGQLL